MGKPFKLTNGCILVSAESAGGLYNAAQLKQIAEIVDAEAAVVKVSEDQRLTIFFAEEKQEEVAAKLRQVGLGMRHYGDGLHQPTSCLGALCPLQKQDALNAALKIGDAFSGKSSAMPIRTGVNGCEKCCVPTHTLDVSIVGDDNGYKINIGGKNSQIPEMATFAAEAVPADKLAGLVDNVVTNYLDKCEPDESMQDTIERIGMSSFIEALAPYSQDASDDSDPFSTDETETETEVSAEQADTPTPDFDDLPSADDLDLSATAADETDDLAELDDLDLSDDAATDESIDEVAEDDEVSEDLDLSETAADEADDLAELDDLDLSDDAATDESIDEVAEDLDLSETAEDETDDLGELDDLDLSDGAADETDDLAELDDLDLSEDAATDESIDEVAEDDGVAEDLDLSEAAADESDDLGELDEAEAIPDLSLDDDLDLNDTGDDAEINLEDDSAEISLEDDSAELDLEIDPESNSDQLDDTEIEELDAADAELGKDEIDSEEQMEEQLNQDFEMEVELDQLDAADNGDETERSEAIDMVGEASEEMEDLEVAESTIELEEDNLEELDDSLDSIDGLDDASLEAFDESEIEQDFAEAGISEAMEDESSDQADVVPIGASDSQQNRSRPSLKGFKIAANGSAKIALENGAALSIDPSKLDIAVGGSMSIDVCGRELILSNNSGVLQLELGAFSIDLQTKKAA